MSLEAHRDSVVGLLKKFYADGAGYGNLTQRQHALQCARQAEMAGAPDAVIIGCLLHDIGWKLARPLGEEAHASKEHTKSTWGAPPAASCLAAELGILTLCSIPDGAGEAQVRAQHDVVGAAWCRMMGFDDVVAHVIEGHVLAKRYLCWKESDYHAKLSSTSQRTLKFQGGPLTDTEAALFEQDPLFACCCEMRRWDEGSKVPAWTVPELDYYVDRIRSTIITGPTRAGTRPGCFKRQGNTIVGLNHTAALSWHPPQSVAPALRAPRATELLAQWMERGYVVIRRDEWIGAAGAEHLSTWCENVANLPYTAGSTNGPFHTWEEGHNGKSVPSRTEAIVDHHPQLNEFLRGKGSVLAAMVSHLASAPVALYKDKLNYKFPGGGGYMPHQDGYTGLGVPNFESSEKRGFITYVCMIAVDAADRSNGCPQVAPTTWKRKEGWVTPKPPTMTEKEWKAAGAYSKRSGQYASSGEKGDMWDALGPFVPVEMERGDVLIYDNFMPHRSTPNTSERARRALFAVYYDSKQYGNDLRQQYYEKEATGRRAEGSQGIAGKANIFFTGKPALSGQAAKL